jgi:anti-anti-sigma factor
MAESGIVEVQEQSDYVILRVLPDRLDEQQLRGLQALARSTAEAHPGWPCILDLARVGYLPSLSLGALIRMHSEFQGRRQRLILAGLQPQVRDVFVMTRLDRVLELQDDVAAATRSLRPT